MSSQFQSTMLSNNASPQLRCFPSSAYKDGNNLLGFESNLFGFASSGKRQCRIRCSKEAEGKNVFQNMGRRGVLLGSSGLPLLLNNWEAKGSPIEPPDLTICRESTPTGKDPVNCCFTSATDLVDYTLPSNPGCRTRPAAHKVDCDYALKYNKAYRLLRALPDDDPRKQLNQGYLHCMFCDSVLDMKGTTYPFDIHHSWIFLPWHRWYLYFHERILQSLLDDSTFSLPFWNWDNQSVTDPLPNTIPDLYINYTSLYDSLRSSVHQPDNIVDVSWSPGRSESYQNDKDTLRATNNSVLYQQIVSGGKTAKLFMGGEYRAGDSATPGGGTFEEQSHGFVHVWTGNENQPNYEDMGSLYSAGQDPIFFAHHANVDRIWWTWKTVLGRSEFTDTDWLDASFVFFDENKQAVKVKVRDALDIHAMGYSYEEMPLTWINTQATTSGSTSSTSSSSLSTLAATSSTESSIPEFGTQTAGKSQALSSPFSSTITIPSSSASETVLVIQGVELPITKALGFDVFINLPSADSSTSFDIIEYAGSYFNVPHAGSSSSSNMSMSSNVRIGLSDTMKSLSINRGDSIVVTLVPRNGGSDIVIKGFDIEFE